MNAQVEDGFFIHSREILAMLYRRRIALMLAVVAGALLSIGAIMMQKQMYTSSATLLIDSQLIPTTVVASPLTSIANERIGKIRQQIVSRESLSSIIRAQGLYPRERASMAFDDVLNVMRGAVGVELVGASQGDASTGRTIAFTLSFTYEDPVAAQAVTRTLTEMFLREDKRFRTEQATGTAAFLGRRADELRRQLSQLEENRRGIEARYAGALPNQVGLSAQSEATLRAEVSRIDAETQGLAQQNSLLAARERELSMAPRPGDEALQRAQERLNQLSAVYADNYPEVAAARAAVARQREALQAAPPGDGSVIQVEIAAGRSRIGMLASRRAQLVSTISDMDRRTALAPQASYELAMVEREYDNLKRQYEDLREKQLDAQVAANLQSEDKGERFSIVDEPSMPHESISPKRLALLLAGLVAGAGAGVFLILAYELLNGTIHGETTLARIMGRPVMGILPLDRGSGRRVFGIPIPTWLDWRSAGGPRHAS
jgi:uncharacterized protein involved in exopolysaccharide biosynthesis